MKIKRLIFLVLAMGLLPLSLQSQGLFTDKFQDGYVWGLWQTNYTQTQLDQMIDRIIASGARHVEIPVFGCQTDLTSSDIHDCDVKEKALVLKMADRAKLKYLGVSFLPIMRTIKWEWRGFFAPSNLEAWFENYTQWIVDWAQEAQKRNMVEFVVASEFKSLMSYTNRWRVVVKQVRKYFSGAVIFTANWDLFENGPWESVDAIGMSAYFPLAAGSSSPIQSQLDLSWNNIKSKLISFSEKWSLPIHITEVGYVNAESAARTPWFTDPNDKRDDLLQARCFQAFSNTWIKEKKLVRTSIWKVGDMSHELEIDADPIGRPAEAILKYFFDKRSFLD